MSHNEPKNEKSFSGVILADLCVTTSGLETSDFSAFRICFGFRISDFEFGRHWTGPSCKSSAKVIPSGLQPKFGSLPRAECGRPKIQVGRLRAGRSGSVTAVSGRGAGALATEFQATFKAQPVS
jgi:hypothetical protein